VCKKNLLNVKEGPSLCIASSKMHNIDNEKTKYKKVQVIILDIDIPMLIRTNVNNFLLVFTC
jgi:hypothetical protein